MTEIAFYYRARRDEELIAAYKGDILALAENMEYVIHLTRAPLTSIELGRLKEIGYEPISNNMGVLVFRNFVGTTSLAGVRLKVTSTKLGHGGIADLLERVSRLSSNLVFGWRSPTELGAKSSAEQRAPIPYHQLQFLREVILRRSPGERLHDFFEAVERNPTRHFVLQRPVVQAAKARNFDARSVIDIFSHPERLVALDSQASVKGNPLAKALRIGQPPLEHFPTHVSVSSRRLSYDTPENRFVKHLLAECLSIIYRLLDEKNLHRQMRLDCREMATMLESSSRALFLSDVGVLCSFEGPTQALAKADGYKDLFDLWIALGAHQSLPGSESEVEQFLQGKNVALLYEYWVFLEVLQAVTTATNSVNGPVSVSRDNLGEALSRDLLVQLSSDITVSFNPSFIQSSHTNYSTPLRPDVVVSLGSYRYAFDAKYRLQWLSAANETQDNDATFVRTDIHKMHTYRDAITNMRAAFVVYPGTEFVFFERGVGRRNAPIEIVTPDGVGAIPARPDDAQSSALLDLMRVLLSKSDLL